MSGQPSDTVGFSKADIICIYFNNLWKTKNQPTVYQSAKNEFLKPGINKVLVIFGLTIHAWIKKQNSYEPGFI